MSMENIFNTNIVLYIIVGLLILLSLFLLFFWEKKKMKLWLRLPIINLVTLIILLILGITEQFYLTCHPEERTRYIRTSIFQMFFIP